LLLFTLLFKTVVIELRLEVLAVFRYHVEHLKLRQHLENIFAIVLFFIADWVTLKVEVFKVFEVFKYL